MIRIWSVTWETKIDGHREERLKWFSTHAEALEFSGADKKRSWPRVHEIVNKAGLLSFAKTYC